MRAPRRRRSRTRSSRARGRSQGARAAPARAVSRDGSSVGVAAAGAAACGAVRRLAVLDLEAVAAATRRGDVRVVDLEAGLLQALEEVDRRALEVRRAERVDDDSDPVKLELVVAGLSAAVEAERVLEAAAAAALDGDAEHLGLAGRLFRHQRRDLLRGARGEGDDGGL